MLASAACPKRRAPVNRWDEKAGLRRDALSSQVIGALEAQETKETGNEEAYHYGDAANTYGSRIRQAARTPKIHAGKPQDDAKLRNELFSLDDGGDGVIMAISASRRHPQQ